MAPTSSYTSEQIEQAVDEVPHGASVEEIGSRRGIKYRTLARWVKAARDGKPAVRRPRGPPPLLPAEAEQNLFEWVLGRQQVFHPVERQDVIKKASEISEVLFNRSIGEGWYKRFMARHPALSMRTAQEISKARNEVDESDVRRLFDTLEALYNEHQFEAERVFNVDETAFESRKKSKRVLAATGSTNVWNSAVKPNFHLTIVACGSAARFIVPPTFILPGKTVQIAVLNECIVPGATVTTAESGFRNALLFARWLEYFAESVPSHVRHSLLLIMDGCTSHYSEGVLEVALKAGVLSVCLPANATHLFQPLDIAVFGSFKSRLRQLINGFVGDEGHYSIDKANALRLAGLAWQGCNFQSNIIAGFKGCGIYPLSRLTMVESLSNYQRNGADPNFRQAAWFHVRTTIQQELLVLPPPRKKTKTRTTATVSGRLLTRELLADIANGRHSTKSSKGTADRVNCSKKRKKKAQDSDLYYIQKNCSSREIEQTTVRTMRQL